MKSKLTHFLAESPWVKQSLANMDEVKRAMGKFTLNHVCPEDGWVWLVQLWCFHALISGVSSECSGPSLIPQERCCHKEWAKSPLLSHSHPFLVPVLAIHQLQHLAGSTPYPRALRFSYWMPPMHRAGLQKSKTWTSLVSWPQFKLQVSSLNCSFTLFGFSCLLWIEIWNY